MRAGLLRHSVVIETPAPNPERDAHGGVPAAWEVLRPQSCFVEDLSGRELELARLQEARATHRVTFRYSPDITQACRFRFARNRSGEVILNVASVTHSETDDETVVLAEQVVGAEVRP